MQWHQLKINTCGERNEHINKPAKLLMMVSYLNQTSQANTFKASSDARSSITQFLEDIHSNCDNFSKKKALLVLSFLCNSLLFTRSEWQAPYL